jgi:hypothetical protein
MASEARTTSSFDDCRIENSVSLPLSVVLDEVRWLLQFPFPQVCRHLVAGRLLDQLERHGYPLTNDLARAVVRAEDENALEILNG